MGQRAGSFTFALGAKEPFNDSVGKPVRHAIVVMGRKPVVPAAFFAG
jgi:hypothetical protein